MEIILKEDIKNLGYKNDIITVKPGYARNYLIPQKLAILATDSEIRNRNEIIKQMQHKLEKIKKDAVSLSEKIGESVIEILAKAGETGKIFGSITVIQVSDALKKRGFEVDKKKISIPEIKELGTYEAVLDLHKEIKHKISIKIVTE